MAGNGYKSTHTKETSSQVHCLDDLSNSISTKEMLKVSVNGDEHVKVNTSSQNKTTFSAGATGHVIIKNTETGEVLVDDHNDVHLENLGEAIALCLARFDSGYIEKIVFGNYGTVISSTGEIYYNAPNTTGANAGLYNQTYSKVVNDRSPYYVDNPDRTFVKVEHQYGANHTDIKVNCVLDFNEPADAAPFDDLTVPNGRESRSEYGRYIFDEVGLTSYNYNTGVERLLTHIIFNPIQKSLNRSIEIDYTLRITIIPE